MSDTKRTSLASLANQFTDMYRRVKGSFGNESKGDAVHNAGTPLAPREADAVPLQYQFRVGQNLTTQPRESMTPFQTLRTLADTLDLVRIAIEMRKEQIRGLDWDIVNAEQDDKTDYPEDIKRVKAFWRKPDGINSQYDWIGMLLEDVLVIDALSLYKRKNRKGDIFGVEVVDGATIKPLIDSHGRTPLPPLPAYQQIIHGYPQGNYTVDEFIYKPRNRRSYTPYGCSPVEWILMTVNIALRKQQFALGYFTEGNMPDGGIYAVPDNWTPAQIKQYQEYWDMMMTGNMANRQKMRFVPKGGYTATKTFEFNQEFEEWLARLVCTAFQINSQPFLKFTNRATAEISDDQQTDYGLKPLCLYLENVFNDIIATDLGCPHLKFKFTSEKAADEALVVDKNVKYVGAGIYSIDEVRTAEGKEPLYPQGLPPYIMVGGKPTFLTKEILDKMLSDENFQTPSEAQESAMEVMQGQADAKARAMGGGKQTDEDDEGGKGSQAVSGKPKGKGEGKDKPEPKEAEKAVLSELKKWEKFALNRLGKTSSREFEPTEVVPEWVVKRISTDLKYAETEDDVRNVFKSGVNRMVRANMPLVEEEIDKVKKDLAKEFERAGRDFLAWLDEYHKDPQAALEAIYGYQFVGVSFRDRVADIMFTLFELGWEDGRTTLGGLLNRDGTLDIEFNSVHAGRWAKKYAAKMVVGLNSRSGEMIRKSIRDIVTQGVKDEVSWQTLKGQLVTALQGHHAFSERRCETIARTESAMAYNIGAVDAWQKSKVVEALLVYDGDYDAACQTANGQTWTFDEALFEPVEHPNCWREFFPILKERINT